MSAVVRGLAFDVVQVVLNDTDRHPEVPVDAAHPLGVAARQVVVDGDDVYTLAFERVEIGGQGRDERLAFAGFHFGDPAGVEHHAADQLHVEVAHVEHAPPCLAHERERLGHQGIERFAGGVALRASRALRAAPQLVGFRSHLDVAQLANRIFELVDPRHDRTQTLQLAFVLRADDFGEEGIDHAEAAATANSQPYHGRSVREARIRTILGKPARRVNLECRGVRSNRRLKDAAGPGVSLPGEKSERVDCFPVEQDFVVQVRRRGPARCTDVTDDITTLDLLARAHGVA